MELLDFLRQTQAEVREGLISGADNPASGCPYPELVFTEVVMQHMCEIGMTFEPVVCHYSAKVGNANLRLSGYALSEDSDQIDLFVSLYSGLDELATVPDSETKAAADQCLRFLSKCAEGKLTTTMDQSTDAYGLALNIQECYPNLDQIRIYVLTDRVVKAKVFKAREIGGKTVKLEVIDIERLHRHWSEGKPRDEITINFKELSGDALPCVCVPGTGGSYDCALTVFPGKTLSHIYDKFGARLLEANVRSFLSTTKKVNRGIRDTLKDTPEKFMAYNNGIVIIADEVRWGETLTGGPGIMWLKGMQIVNGGQTTASIYFAKKKNPDINLDVVRIPAKVLVLKSVDAEQEENLISDISRYANSQTSVQQADLSANRPFHVEIEKMSTTVYCPDGVSRWFYERATGSYSTLLAREGTTPAKLKKLKDSMPAARRMTKTDLAKYINAWAQKPHLVSLGSQKNFIDLMKELENEKTTDEIDPSYYKRLIAKAIIFRTVQKLVRPMFQAFQANVAAYLVSLLSFKTGGRLDLNRIWLQQELSQDLRLQLTTWAVEVNSVLHKSANGRMVSEWAKKPDCWTAVQDATYSTVKACIPEIV
jgi:hypothetical protein